MSENSGDYASVPSPEGATASPEPAECGEYEVDAPVVRTTPPDRGPSVILVGDIGRE